MTGAPTAPRRTTFRYDTTRRYAADIRRLTADRWLTTEEVAVALSVSRRCAYNACRGLVDVGALISRYYKQDGKAKRLLFLAASAGDVVPPPRAAPPAAKAVKRSRCRRCGAAIAKTPGVIWCSRCRERVQSEDAGIFNW